METRELLFRVWDKDTSKLLPTTDGLVFSNSSMKNFGITNYLQNPKRYLCTVLCYRDEKMDVYGLDVIDCFSKDYDTLKDAESHNAPVQRVLCDLHGFVNIDGKRVHVTDLKDSYNFESKGFVLYTEAYKRAFINDINTYTGLSL